MANAETLRDFLISLGFKIDDSGMRKFQSVVTGVSANVIKLGATVEGAALAVVGFTTQIAAGLDKMYWASQRTGASVAGIKALGYAASLTGSSAEAASGSLENLARFLRNSPGAEGFLNRLGVQTRDANGNLQDMSAIFTRVGNKLTSMPYYRANQYAQLLGIDENTLMAMRRGINAFSADYQRMLKQTGFTADLAAKQSNQFMISMKGLTGLFGIFRDKIGSHLAGGLSREIDNLQKRLLDNFPKIERVLTSIIKGSNQAGGMVSRVIWRVSQVIGQVFDWWRNLDEKSKTLITTFSGLAAAIWLLNRAFFASPIGIITGLIAALLLLWEDYQTWKEGGKSFINWSKWESEINQVKAAFKWLGEKLTGLVDLVGGWQNALELLAIFIAGAWVSKVLAAFGKIAKLPIPPWLKLWGLYAGYLISDKENISDSANASWDYNTRQVKRAIGNGLDFFGIDNSWANKNQGGNIPDNIADVPTGRPKPSTSGRQLLGWLQPTLGKLEQLYRLPEGLLRSVAITESGGNQFAISRAGAKGLFQLMDGTARDLGLNGNEVFDPVKSAQAAARYLAQLFKMNGGDIEKTLASYNWGIGNVQRHGMALMPQETRNYIPKVLGNMPGSSGNSVAQETNIYVQGALDPRSTANAIADKQTGVNARLIGQLTQRAY
ncbi:transglycosylase SLT domain-containing protein [Candidatus Arsenophonus triatominarum]|uniref:transglycosylase SLT domain-containing protein n=1 Tax=Candidatus Arsenophonus triatominarum TaxID=57911 RepID=UPI0007C481F2|nr:transglycosylase SLT domain-containing protein [Candidatus Arsenophonus triatominarum]